MILSLLSLVAFSVPTVAKEVPYSVSLTADSYVRLGEPVRVKLHLNSLQNCKIPKGWFTGEAFQLRVNGKDLGLFGKGNTPANEMSVPLLAGTKLELSIPINSKKLVSRFSETMKPGSIFVCELGIPKVPTARVKFQVVQEPQVSDLERLDLARTKVAMVTNFGTMLISFRPDKAPKTVANFVKLSLKHFYDKTKFHRVIPGFMIQGGDPNSKNDNPDDDGMGDPGYKIDAEFNDIVHERGVLSMARSADPNSAGSQFFICHAKASHLDGKYTAFGKLVQGLDVLDRICRVPLGLNRGGQKTRPTKDVVVLRTVVLPVWK
jgi:peptidyl-prolyl cis-trans isomerase B (cyclophilin B)